jgi:hypothetical protein
LVALGLGVAGCGGADTSKFAHAAGKVLFKGDPVDRPALTFHRTGPGDPVEFKAKGEKDGSFVIPAIPPGEYLVSIDRLKKTSKESVERKNLLPARYADPKTSGLKVVIKTDNNALEPFSLVE